MKPYEIENWALGVMARVEANQPNEDARVELKARWPEDLARAARQLAGHANAVGGGPILWLIGVDQKKGIIIGANHEEIADWYARLQTYFDGLAPQVTDINVPVRNGSVVALLFDTDRVPFVVKNPAFGVEKGDSIQREVPWREGASTRSATRADLLRLLVPGQKIPDYEVMGGRLMVNFKDNQHNAEYYIWSLHLELFIYPKEEGRIVIPDHKCEVSFEIPGCVARTNFEKKYLCSMEESAFDMDEGTSTGLMIYKTKTSLIIEGPGLIEIVAEVTTPKITLYSANVHITGKLLPVGADHPLAISTMLFCAGSSSSIIGEWIRNSPYNEAPGVRTY